MNELDAFSPVFTDGVGDPEIIIIPVIGIIVLLFIGKFGGKFIKFLARTKRRISVGLVQSNRSEC